MGLSRLIAIVLLALLAPGLALADVCRSIQAELATIGRGDPATASRHAQEAGRIHAHMRSIGCERSGIFAFGAPPPPECGGLAARMRQHQHAGAQASGGEGRRRELMSMLVSYNCRTRAEPPRGRPLVAGLFDDYASRRPSSLEIRPDTPIDPGPPIESRIRSVSGKTICVRTCDGYYFPVSLRPGTRSDEGDEVCQSLCPAVPTRLYSLRGAEVADAVSTEGEAYDDLPAAFSYRKRFDPSCFCRRPGETAGPGPQVLNPDDPTGPGLQPLNGDEVLEEPPLRGFSERPRKPQERRDASAFGKKPPPAPPAPPHPNNEAPAARTVTTEQGETREFQARDGSRRTVRIIAPELSRAQEEAKAPSAPDRAPAP
jgi:hypothetical protein